MGGRDRRDRVHPRHQVDLVDLDGRPIDREALYWEHEGNRAVRSGDWKLVAKHKGPWELYDLSRDRVESTDLAAKRPEKVEQLAAMYAAWAGRARVESPESSCSSVFCVRV